MIREWIIPFIVAFALILLLDYRYGFEKFINKTKEVAVYIWEYTKTMWINFFDGVLNIFIK